MNICIISYHSCPFSPLGLESAGGMNVYIRELSFALSNFPNIKIDIFTRIQHKDLKGIKNISDKIRIIHLKGGPECFINKKNLYHYIEEFGENLINFILTNKLKYEIIYTHYWLSGLIGKRIKNKFNLPLIHNYHTLAFMKNKLTRGKYKENPNRLNAERFLFHVSDGIIISSQNEKENILKEYKIPCWKLRIIYPGVNQNIFYPVNKSVARKKLGLHSNDKIILYVGRIEPVKGLFTIVEALEILKRNKNSLYNHLKLVVVGGGNKALDFQKNREILRIMNFIKEKNIFEKVVFFGSKEQNLLRNYYSASDVLIVPSLYESFGLVTIESLACGTPVIVSRTGEMAKIIHENKNGFHFSPNNPLSLANAILRFFKNRESLWKKEEIRENIIKKFSWKKTAEETFDFLKKILEIHKFKKEEVTTRFQYDENLLLI